MSDEDWEGLEAREVSTIRLSLAPELKYSVMDEKSPSKLWEKLEKFYIFKSLTNRLFMKKQLHELKMSEETDVRDHINNSITQLLSVNVRINEENKVVILLASLTKSYETLITTLLVGKITLTVDEVSTVLLETADMKQPCSLSHTEQVLMVKSDASKGRSKTWGRYYERRDDRSQSSSWKDVECFYCNEKGHIRRNCEELIRHLEEKRK